MYDSDGFGRGNPIAIPIAIEPIVSQYGGLNAARVESLGNSGGFSGARFWRLSLNGDSTPMRSAPAGSTPVGSTPAGSTPADGRSVEKDRDAAQEFCLRRWPAEHPTREHLRWIHDLLAHTAQQGLNFVPVPIRNESGESFCEHGGYRWELTPWMPGRADFCETIDDADRQTRLINAMKALALWHNGAARFQPSKIETAPGVRMRLRRHQALREGKLALLRRSVQENRFRVSANIVSTANELLSAFANAQDLSPDLRRMSQVAVPLQSCVRDIWHDHVLFSGNDVTGIVDFGAARVAAREGDVARLLGSLSSSAQPNSSQSSSSQSSQTTKRLWATGLNSYQASAIQPVNTEMAQIWHLANVCMSGLQWIEWLFEDGRRFDDPEAVHRRMADFLFLQKNT